ncbi:hypothetical protein MNBD_GAMMA13-455 [hydrothermal vent metagenome]|uniref:Integrase n=1 Tax=hydrothermal vent metagenome TaxID=652676 RepID=A0A3B0Z2Z9_9ZZZZ
MHGLRHAYAQNRYEEITGWKCPAAGGPSKKSLTPQQREIDQAARLTISQELGHERAQIIAAYQTKGVQTKGVGDKSQSFSFVTDPFLV